MHAASLRESFGRSSARSPPPRCSPATCSRRNDPFTAASSERCRVLRPVSAADGAGRDYFRRHHHQVADLGGGYAGGVAATAQHVRRGHELPPVHLYRAGEPEAVVWKIIENNSRTPEKVIGDIRALVWVRTSWPAGSRTGRALRLRRSARARRNYIAYPKRACAGAAARYPRARTRQLHHRLRRHRGEQDVSGAGAVTLPGDVRSNSTSTAPTRRRAVRSRVLLAGALGRAVRRALPSRPEHSHERGLLQHARHQIPARIAREPEPAAACGGRIVVVTARWKPSSRRCPKSGPMALASSGIVHLYGMSVCATASRHVAAHGHGLRCSGARSHVRRPRRDPALRARWPPPRLLQVERTKRSTPS